MRNTKDLYALFGWVALLIVLTFARGASAQTSSFTYQGKLADSGVAANGTYDITFRLFDALANGTQVGSAVVRDDIVVSDGAFSVDLDFGVAAFASGALRYLELEVRPGASVGAYTPLVPRQPLTSSPYAVKAASATSADTLSNSCILCVRDEKIDTVGAGKVTGVLGYFQGGTGLGGPGPFPVAGLFLRSTGSGLGLQGLTASDIPNNSVTTSRIVDASVTAPKIADYAVTTDKLGDNAVITGKIADSAVTAPKIADGAVTASKLAPGSVNATQIGALAITSTALGDGAVLTNKISDGAVTTGKIAVGAVTAAKIAAGVVFRWNVITGNQQSESNNGYLANSAGEVTVTLPTAPNVGDTIRVSGTGIGGWRIAQNDGQRILLSSLPPVLRFWQSVASSADGTKLVAVVDNGQIFTSTDSGAIWTPRYSNRMWRSVASSSDGSRLVAAAWNSTLEPPDGFIYTSTDYGANWAPRESARNWDSVASSSDGVKLVATSGLFGGEIYTSTDAGANWTPRDSARTWSSVASSSDGSKLVAAVGGGQIYTSADSGANWTPHDINRNWSSVASSADGSKLVAVVGGGQIYTSTDSGANWTPRDSNRNWYSVATSADGSKLVAVVNGGMIYTSTDSGTIWTPRDSNRNWWAVASSADGSKLVAVVRGGGIYTSTDSGVTWATLAPGTTTGTGGYLTGGQLTAIELIYIGGGQFLPLSSQGTLTAQ